MEQGASFALLCEHLPKLGHFLGLIRNACHVYLKGLITRQSWKMSNLLHGPEFSNQILPREKRVNRDIFGTSNLNYQFMAVVH